MVSTSTSRTPQLEAYNLDSEVSNIIATRVDGLDLDGNEEIKLWLKLILFYYKIKNRQSVGQQILNLKLVDSTKNNIDENENNISKFKIFLLAASEYIVPYIARKQQYNLAFDYSSYLEKYHQLPQWFSIENLSCTIRAMSLANFFSFLLYGKYLTIHERLTGITSKSTESTAMCLESISQAQLVTINQQLTFEAIADTLTFIVPIVNFTKLKNALVHYINSIFGQKSNKDVCKEEFSTVVDDICSICKNQPFNPYNIGCKHVFCYSCLFGTHMNDVSNSFVCTSCGYETDDLTDVKMYMKQ